MPPLTQTTARGVSVAMVLHAALGPRPEVLVELHLQAHRQTVVEDPAAEGARVERAGDRREEQRAAVGHPPLPDEAAGPPVAAAAAAPERHLVSPLQEVEVAPFHPRAL